MTSREHTLLVLSRLMQYPMMVDPVMALAVV